MTERDLIKRGALIKLEEIVRSCLESCGRDVVHFKLEMKDDAFTKEELDEIAYIIKKLQNSKEFLNMFIQIRGL